MCLSKWYKQLKCIRRIPLSPSQHSENSTDVPLKASCNLSIFSPRTDIKFCIIKMYERKQLNAPYTAVWVPMVFFCWMTNFAHYLKGITFSLAALQCIKCIYMSSNVLMGGKKKTLVLSCSKAIIDSLMLNCFFFSFGLSRHFLHRKWKFVVINHLNIVKTIHHNQFKQEYRLQFRRDQYANECNILIFEKVILG